MRSCKGFMKTSVLETAFVAPNVCVAAFVLPRQNIRTKVLNLAIPLEGAVNE